MRLKSVLLCVICLLLFALKAYCITNRTLGFEFLNDAFFKEDNKISSSWAMLFHSNIARSWEEFGKWGSKLENIDEYLGGAKDLYHRITFSVGQLIQTPDDLDRSDLIEDDVPYAGLLVGSINFYSYNSQKFNGLQLVVGVVGPLSLGEQTQKFVHRKDPKGWTHQLHTEPILNLNFMVKRKLFKYGCNHRVSMDLDVGSHAGVGNLFTEASLVTDFRFGYNLPGGFTYNPYPVGFNLNYNAEVPRNKDKWSFYITLGISTTGFARNLLFDGNTIRDSHSVDKKDFVAQFFGGIHLVKGRFALRFYALVTTDDVDVGSTYKGADNERFGTILLEWTF
ncbi:lipid A deacylase LpxR family protein [Desulfothermus sp.]